MRDCLWDLLFMFLWAGCVALLPWPVRFSLAPMVNEPSSRLALLAKAFLLASALAYLGLGIRFLLFPQGGAANLGFLALDVSGLNSVRSIPGGFQGSIGVLLLFFLAQGAAYTRVALHVVLFVSCGFLVGRIASLALDGVPNAFVWFATALEILGATGAALFLRLARPRARNAQPREPNFRSSGRVAARLSTKLQSPES